MDEILTDEPVTHTVDIQPEHRFALTDKFTDGWKRKKPNWGPLGEITYRRTYARTKTDGHQEEWWETVRRVVNGAYTYQKWHCRRLGLPWSERKAHASAQEMYALIFDMKFLPPGRGLWMTGTEHVERVGAAAIFNCAFTSTDNIQQDFAEPFCFLMDFSMLGVGVGADTKGAGKVTIRKPVVHTEPHIVPDTREGWVDLVRRVLNAYVGRGTMPPSIDYSKVRQAGVPIKGFGGVSAGPEPLDRLVTHVKSTLDQLVGKPMTSTAIVDIFNQIGVCVVSGNVRRSAELILGEHNDPEFAELKDPTKHQAELNAFRWASNNSIIAEVGMDYSAAAHRTAINGEPGYFWLDNTRHYGRMKDGKSSDDIDIQGLNPCAEIGLESAETCNICETFPARHDSYDDYERTLKLAYLYTKSITLVPTHNPKTNARIMKNRRIGISQTGIIDNCAKIGRREHLRWCDKGYAYIKQLDRVYSNWLCVPLSRKLTTVKPSGTVSLLTGSSPGIHHPHAEYYYRTIRFAKTSPLVKLLNDAGHRVEDALSDPYSVVAYFPVRERHFQRAKDDVSMWEQLEIAAAMQAYWADNAVSVTVTFKPHEAGDIKHALELYETRLKSVSFLPLVEHGYAQAPYQTISQAEYEAAIAKLSPVNYKTAGHEVTDAYCDGDSCVVQIPLDSQQAA